MTNLEQTKGDTAGYNFKRKDTSGQTITTEPDALYFTVKASWNDKRPLIQKKKSDMIMDNDGTWHFTIQASDTDNLPYGNYVYDIEVIDNDAVQTIVKGKYTLTVESTWHVNEV